MTRTRVWLSKEWLPSARGRPGECPCGYEQKDRAAMQLPQRSALCATLNEEEIHF